MAKPGPLNDSSRVGHGPAGPSHGHQACTDPGQCQGGCVAATVTEPGLTRNNTSSSSFTGRLASDRDGTGPGRGTRWWMDPSINQESISKVLRYRRLRYRMQLRYRSLNIRDIDAVRYRRSQIQNFDIIYAHAHVDIGYTYSTRYRRLYQISKVNLTFKYRRSCPNYRVRYQILERYSRIRSMSFTAYQRLS
jgi:hypothetical protein